MAYTTSTDYATYTGEAAPVDYTRQELYATTLFKSVYPWFPSEDQYTNDIDATTQQLIEYAIFEQINQGVDYTGTKGGADSFSVGSFSITNGTQSSADKVASAAEMYLSSCGGTYKGVGGC